MNIRSAPQPWSFQQSLSRMAGYRPSYVDNNQQPANSKHNPQQVLRRRVQQHHAAHQVDSWRSYRNDATNLQQIAGHASMPNYDYTRQQHWSPEQAHLYSFNANPLHFQTTSHGTVSTQSQYAPYQPLRIPNGQQERHIRRQERSISSLTNSQSSRGYAFRSRGTVHPRIALQDVPVPSIEEQVRQSSSIPQNLPGRGSYEYLKRLTPRGSSRTASPPPRPSPSKEYMVQASNLPAKLTSPKKLLIVVDLNGTLLKRAASRGTHFVLRPGVATFMEYLFANHVVMIYTSSRPENAQTMVKKLLHPKQRNQLAAVWARDKLDLTVAQYHAKVQVYKKLEKIWADKDIQNRADDGCKWDQTNTVLLDDSHLKALAQPYNLLRVEEFLNDKPHDGNGNSKGKIVNQEHMDALNTWSAQQLQIIKDLEAKLEELKFIDDVSRLIRTWQLADAEIPDPVNDQSVEAEQIQLMTPKSPEPQVSDSDESDGGVDSRQIAIDELAERINDQTMGNNTAEQLSNRRSASERSVSPIDEAVWKEILGSA